MFYFILFIFRSKNVTEHKRCSGGKANVCKITMDLSYEFPRSCVGNYFVCRITLSPGFWNIFQRKFGRPRLHFVCSSARWGISCLRTCLCQLRGNEKLHPNSPARQVHCPMDRTLSTRRLPMSVGSKTYIECVTIWNVAKVFRRPPILETFLHVWQ